MNEIFKGMDNAAEQINENFKSGSVVESVNEEKYRYTKLGDGTIIMVLEFDFNRSSSETTVSLPIPAIDDRYSVFLMPATGSINTIQDSHSVIAAPASLTEIRVVKSREHSFVSTGMLPLRATIIAKYK